jgi:thiamine-phosphate pyrophosphorylase
VPDPLPSAKQLPRGRAGIVFRHDAAPSRTALGLELARICRERRLLLVVAGDVKLAARLRAGVHLRNGRFSSSVRTPGLVTSSAHSVPDLIRAHRAGVTLAFLSPAFPTRSHIGADDLGPLRWGLFARRAPESLAVAALGGVDGNSVGRLPQRCVAIGAIGALST